MVYHTTVVMVKVAGHQLLAERREDVSPTTSSADFLLTTRFIIPTYLNLTVTPHLMTKI